MQFSTINPGPVEIIVDTVSYKVPRFLLPQMSEWMEEILEKQIERATKHLDDDAKARFLMYMQPPLFDVADIASDVRTPLGVQRLLRRMLPKANPPVPADVIEKMIEFGDADTLRELAERIASNRIGVSTMVNQTGGPGEDGDPLAKQRQESDVSQSTGSKSKRKSLPHTRASTKTDSPSTATSASGSGAPKP